MALAAGQGTVSDTDLAGRISEGGRYGTILLPDPVPAGWRFATDSEVKSSGVVVADPPFDMEASAAIEWFPVFHNPSMHTDFGYEVFFTQDGTHLVAFAVDALADGVIPTSDGPAGVKMQKRDWMKVRNGAGFAWWLGDKGFASSSAEVYGWPTGEVSSDALLQFVRAVQQVSPRRVPLSDGKMQILMAQYEGKVGFAYSYGTAVRAHKESGDWEARVLDLNALGDASACCLFKWGQTGWTLPFYADKGGDEGPLDGDTLLAKGVPEELVTWIAGKGFCSAPTVKSTTTTAPSQAAFAPKPDGWQFQNGSDKNNGDDFVVWSRVFGDGARSKEKFTEQLAEAKADGHSGIFDGGNCYGFATSTASYYNKDCALSAIGLTVTTPWDLGPVDPPVSYFQTTLAHDNERVLEEIEEFQLAQFEEDAAAAEQANTINKNDWLWQRIFGSSYPEILTDWCDRLEAAVAKEPQVITMGSDGPRVGTITGGHGLVAYRTERTGDQFRIWVYDNNYPYNKDHRGEADERYITVVPAKGTWSYELWPGLVWSSEDKGNRISFFSSAAPAQAVNDPGARRYADTTWDFLDVPTLRITDDQGRVTQTGGPEEQWSVPGISPWSPVRLVDDPARATRYLRVGTEAAGLDLQLSLTPATSTTYRAAVGRGPVDFYLSGQSDGSADTLRLPAQGQTLSLAASPGQSRTLTLATNWGPPALTLDISFTSPPGGAPAGAGAESGADAAAGPGEASFAVSQTAGGLVVDLDTGGVLASTLRVTSGEGTGQTVELGAARHARIEVTPGSTGGADGQYQVAVKFDAGIEASSGSSSTSTSIAAGVMSTTESVPPAGGGSGPAAGSGGFRGWMIGVIVAGLAVVAAGAYLMLRGPGRRPQPTAPGGAAAQRSGFCPSCGAPLEPDARFCGGCGRPGGG